MVTKAPLSSNRRHRAGYSTSYCRGIFRGALPGDCKTMLAAHDEENNTACMGRPRRHHLAWIILGCALVLLELVAVYRQPEVRGRLAAGFLLTVLFAGGARILRGVSVSGAVAGTLCCLLIVTGGGAAGFAALVMVFVLTWAATRLAGTGNPGRERSASQVFANLSIAAAAIAWPGGHPLLLAGGLAALCEAATDTVASETGKALSPRAWMITTWQPVAAGANGGISLAGTGLGIVAGCGVAGIYFLVARLGAAAAPPGKSILIVIAAGGVGMLVDSILGATLENRGWLDNDAVNLLGTLSAAVLGAIGCAAI